MSTPQYCDATYLCDSGAEFGGFKIWGSPWTLEFEKMNSKCKAFTVKTDKELSLKWGLMLKDTDILITHSPPFAILDIATKENAMVNTGSSSLFEKVSEVQPKLHVFGHIHEQGGKKIMMKRPGIGMENNTTFVNASHLNQLYKPVNQAMRIVL